MLSKRLGVGSTVKTRTPVRRRATIRTPKTLRKDAGEKSGLPFQSFARELNGEKRRLLRELRDAEAIVQDHPSSGNHMADDASEVFEQTKDLALKHHLEQMLDQVNHALARVEKGTFGICENCGLTIQAARLRALPFVAFCFDCAAGKGRNLRT